MRPIFKVAHDKVWVSLTSTFTGSKTGRSGSRNLRNKNSELSNGSGDSNPSSERSEGTYAADEEKGAVPCLPKTNV